MFAMSVGWPTRPNGCLFPAASIFSSLFNNALANGVCVKLGAIALTLILKLENSAARDLVHPTIAPFELAMEA